MNVIIRVYSHHIEILNASLLPAYVMSNYLGRFVYVTTYKDVHGSIHEQDRRIYAASNSRRTYYRIHRHALDDFLNYLDRSGIHSSEYTVEYVPQFVGNAANVEMLPALKPKPNQQPLIDFFVDPEPAIKLCKLQTGQGKTFCALSAAARLGRLFVLIVRPKYIENWEVALYGESAITMVERDRVCIVQGSKRLTKLIHQGLEGELPYDFVIISNTTYANYIKEYEHRDNTKDTYGCDPMDFFKTIGAHCLLRDEVHLDNHLNFRIDLYTHVPLSISLSATYGSSDPVLSRMQTLQYPPSTHAPLQTHIKYVHVTALRFTIRMPTRLRWALRGRNDYNHIAFETSVLKNPMIKIKWLEAIVSIVGTEYVKRMKPGQRFIVTASSRNMVFAIADAVQHAYPEMNVQTYMQGSNFVEVRECDILVTTVVSGTAAIDIKNLIGGLMTTAIGAEETNLQAIGRIRESKDFPDAELRFCYLYTRSIPQSQRYHETKQRIFEHRVLSHSDVALDLEL